MVAAEPPIMENRLMNKSDSHNYDDRGADGAKASKDALDNRSRQLNPEHRAFWRARGLEGRPDRSGGGSSSNPRKR